MITWFWLTSGTRKTLQRMICPLYKAFGSHSAGAFVWLNTEFTQDLGSRIELRKTIAPSGSFWLTLQWEEGEIQTATHWLWIWYMAGTEIGLGQKEDHEEPGQLSGGLEYLFCPACLWVGATLHPISPAEHPIWMPTVSPKRPVYGAIIKYTVHERSAYLYSLYLQL